MVKDDALDNIKLIYETENYPCTYNSVLFFTI